MAENDVDPTVIKRTQETLGKYIKKPPLTDKLLKKPPFRFLHDVLNAVIKETGCFLGLYTAEELTCDNIKDREDKMKFLQKLIDVVKITTKSSVTVRTSKIVAGHEPDKTNALLQLIGEIIEKQLDWRSAVDKVLSGGTVEKSTSKSKATADKTKESKSKEKPKEKTKEKDNKVKDSKTKETKSTAKTISPAGKTDKVKKTAVGNKEKEKTVSKTIKDRTVKESKEKEKTKAVQNDVEKSNIAKAKTENKQKSPSPVKTEIKEESKLVEQVKSAENDMTKELKRRSARDERKASAKVVAENTQVTENATEILKEARRGSKSSDDMHKSLESTKAAMSPAKETENQPKENESRNSSGQQRVRKSSSSDSRRSSATTRDEAGVTAQQISLSNQESLRTLNEEEHVQVTAAPTKTLLGTTAAPPAPTPLMKQNSNEVRRESTFTRENSKDSMSNTAATRPRTSLRPPSARPASARPGAPRRRDKNVEIILQPNDQVKMSNINVKLEAFGDLDDDGENLVIIEDANAEHITGINEMSNQNNATTTIDGNGLEQQGHLVQQILETQKELIQQPVPLAGKTEKESMGGLNARQSSARQMNNLRDVIQNLTKSVNPLGKLMDFIPEDIDAMTLELTMWSDTYTQAASELKHERSLTESATEPMKNQLVQIEASIKEYLEMIDASRLKILQNSEKILKMLTEQ